MARSALAVLDADPQLRDVNLLVSVVDRVAVIGGPVPNPETARRAEAVLRERVPGLADVKNRCFVQQAPDPLIRAVADRLGPRPPAFPELPGVVPHPRTGMVFAPPPVAEVPIVPATPWEQPFTSLKPPSPSTGGVLGGPVGPARPVADPPAVALAPIPAAVVPSPPTGVPTVLTTGSGRPGDLLLAAATVRRSNPTKFGGLTTELQDGTLIIGGSAARAKYAWDYAEALRRVPGMVRVAVGAVDVP
jgi:hypothetical protein